MSGVVIHERDEGREGTEVYSVLLYLVHVSLLYIPDIELHNKASW